MNPNINLNQPNFSPAGAFSAGSGTDGVPYSRNSNPALPDTAAGSSRRSQQSTTLSTVHPGRSAPVREVAPQQSTPQSSHTRSQHATIHNDAIAQQTQQPLQPWRDQPGPSRLGPFNHPVGWNRPYSSGRPAPATAVPIFRAQFGHLARTTELPDSPPDTPPQSPPLMPLSRPRGQSHHIRIDEDLHLDAHSSNSNGITSNTTSTGTGNVNASAAASLLATHLDSNDLLSDVADDDDAISLAATDDSATTQSTIELLTQAANSLFVKQQQQQQHQPRTSAVDAKSPQPQTASTSAITIGGGIMPATPEISPDNNVRHYAQKSARAFLQRIFSDVNNDVAVEDAGVELVSPGWSGAVVKTGALVEPASQHSSSSAAAAADASMASSIGSSASSSADTARTLYVCMPSAIDASLLREQVLAVLDAASEKLGCENVMICLQRHMRDFASVLHGLCYVGATVVAAGNPASLGDSTGRGNPHTTNSNSNTSDITSRLSNTDLVTGLHLRDGLVLVAIEL
ncbi:hypothetical protein BCV70DRAFT_166728 [Testicularia cyperi]|uniref:Ornithine decarboxylase antizyme n=1 Tax=Testicularia cyperi TaxID=1882483 RepID=A0A317XFI7_9BASI|nr:hypothetical protein BCV70DRAFT_167980 [Testicularia cyperi]PWY97577.1 hypothetical protein BCV70DRAFT_166728 [Testicularia cyperi]